ncbi:class II fructose-bisphosphate aldolase [Caldinitratiruptor microaerophilus]|uniref:Tagatose-bisphosphate aldolase n=1 Tax=Caldinitratiruptor microaerophilus TaxID=671077 RepID=A0AA35CMI2_9FIRM|nr:class II fructose-bisphosphate aldolase [Caldinitratiruptor microaerophilus]BDG62055.1 tagatose-bisphosphate aldolase [Caldinitratiruptor microaerophilus]
MPELARFSSMLRTAQRGGYAVAAFNVYNLESIAAALRAAIATRTPVIVALGERYFPNMRPATARAIVDTLLAQHAREGQAVPPVGLHLDHATSPEHCSEAIRAGFTSVMIDGSHLPYRENVRLTRAVVEEAHAHGVEVEAELGGLAAGEASHEFATGEEALTDPDQAREFVAETGVDALAVSVGTVHGLYRGEPRIDLDRLAAIHARVDVPLVLHGGSGTPAGLLRECVARGVAKVNVNTEISLAAVHRIREELEARPRAHFAELGLVAVPEMEEVMKDYIRRFGAAGVLPGI